MSDKQHLTDYEITNLRHNLNLVRSQINAGRIEKDFVMRQLENMQRALETVTALKKEKRSGGTVEALYNVSRALGTSLDLQVVLDQVMDAVIQLTGAERGFLMLRNDDGELEVKVARNLDQQTLGSQEFKFSKTIANKVLDEGNAILTTNAVEDPRFAGQASIVAQSLRSILATPLWARNAVIGVAYVDNRAVTGLFSEDDLATLETFSGQAAVAIDNALLFSETDEKLATRVEELRQLRRVDLQLNEKLDPEQAMRDTLGWACRLSGANEGHLGLLEGKEPQHIIARHHYGANIPTDAEPIFLDSVYPKVWDVVRSGDTLIFDTGQYGLITVMTVPVLRENTVIGVVLLKREDGGHFTENQQDMVERVVTRAAVAIENARLYAAVQAADKAKSEFVGIVAHDLKAPMTSIKGYADLMIMQSADSLTERQREFLQRIQDTVIRMEILVSDLSDISRIESGHFYMDEIHISVNAVVHAVQDMALPQMETRQHTFILEVEEDLPQLWVDYYRLVQVLTNLVSNAYKYTPEGGTITLSARRAGERVQFTVTDTGIGLSEIQIAKLGTKFWRAEDEFTRSQPGTGLGFAITASLVEQMGSKIEIESKVGEGSRFTFDIAIAQDDETSA